MLEPTSIRLYKFGQWEHQLANLRSRTLRVSRLTTLNDPFDFNFGIINIHPNRVEEANTYRRTLLEDFNRKFGLICLTATKDEHLLWSHYAKWHTGIALEFDHIVTPLLRAVNYSHGRPYIDAREANKLSETQTALLFHAIATTKSIPWSYEREYRSIVDLNTIESNDGIFTIPIPESFLTSVILGAKCKTSIAVVQEALAMGQFQGVTVYKAECDEASYGMKFTKIAD